MSSSSKWPIVSQHRSSIPKDIVDHAESAYLPTLIMLWQAIEHQTGYRWKCTSYWRLSPSHKTGAALDIAPDISASSSMHYASNRGSDPVLYKRTKLIRKLQKVCRLKISQEFDMGIYIEPDHLHLQLFAKSSRDSQIRLFKWKLPKLVYADTNERMVLPMMTN